MIVRCFASTIATNCLEIFRTYMKVEGFDLAVKSRRLQPQKPRCRSLIAFGMDESLPNKFDLELSNFLIEINTLPEIKIENSCRVIGFGFERARKVFCKL